MVKGETMKSLISIFSLIVIFVQTLFSQSQSKDDEINQLKKLNEYLEHRLDILEKRIDDVLWFERLKDYAFIDKVFLTGPPKWKEKKSNCFRCRESFKVLVLCLHTKGH